MINVWLAIFLTSLFFQLSFGKFLCAFAATLAIYAGAKYYGRYIICGAVRRIKAWHSWGQPIVLQDRLNGHVDVFTPCNAAAREFFEVNKFTKSVLHGGYLVLRGQASEVHHLLRDRYGNIIESPIRGTNMTVMVMPSPH